MSASLVVHRSCLRPCSLSHQLPVTKRAPVHEWPRRVCALLVPIWDPLFLAEGAGRSCPPKCAALPAAVFLAEPQGFFVQPLKPREKQKTKTKLVPARDLQKPGTWCFCCFLLQTFVGICLFSSAAITPRWPDWAQTPIISRNVSEPRSQLASFQLRHGAERCCRKMRDDAEEG